MQPRHFDLVLDTIEVLEGNQQTDAELSTRSTVEMTQVPPSIEEFVKNIPPSSEYVGSCPGGTFPGHEAQSIPTILHMPFPPSDKGYTTYWRVGDHGSYFGNGMHCNSNNDYYATDWNRVNSNGSYAGSYGYEVRPVAQGTVVEMYCTQSGFGCRVVVEHNLTGNGTDYRTRYAHLIEVPNVYVGQRVDHWNRLGYVGATGTLIAHLH
ncbi:MAG: M23 family metallopeptidase, partial [Anaerolineales bacterium]|nr:M23 family metallopeptidase [Anaerolineales bacterium]